MKKNILTVLAVFALFFVNAQDKKELGFGYAKGDILLGGNIITNIKTNDVNGVSSSSSISTFGPEVAYFISDNFSLDLGITIGSSKAGTNTLETYDVALAGRYYFLNLGQRFKTYTNLGLNFGSNDYVGSGPNKTSTYGFDAGVGINYFISSKVAMNFGFGNFISYKSSKLGSTTTTSINANLNEFNNFFSKPTFGVSYKF
jgi:outer membrane protein